MTSFFLIQDSLILEMFVLQWYSHPYHRGRSSISVISQRVLFE